MFHLQNGRILREGDDYTLILSVLRAASYSYSLIQ